MYDKSKKTWSQRLKISKTEKSSSAAVSTEQQQALLRYQQQQKLLAKPGTNATFTSRRNSGEISPTTTVSKSPVTPQPLSPYKHYTNSGFELDSYDFAPSALSRSMKYAEPWTYGTVRALPNSSRPYYYQASMATVQHCYMVANPAAVFAHPFASSELAIVICSCPEYLSGTKRELKKASVCKKCKGSRLPLTPIGGTVRVHPSSTPVMLKARWSGSATMRITTSSGSKVRPTILDPQKDPYDLMRRSRLISPESIVNGTKLPTSAASPSSAKSSEALATRNRGKNSSPTRGRSRTRTNLPQPTSKAKKSDPKLAKSSSSASGSSAGSYKDCWLVEEPELLCAPLGRKSSSGDSTRRSILRCNVNPYDLISSKSVSSSMSTCSSSHPPTAAVNPTLTASPKIRSQKEFGAPAEHDFDLADANLYDTAPAFTTYSKEGATNGTTKQVTNLTGTGVTQPALPGNGTATNDNSNTEDVGTHESSDVGKKDVDVAIVGDANATSNSKSYANIQAIAGQRISLGETGRMTKKSLIKQSEDGRSYESIIIAGDDAEGGGKEHQSNEEGSKLQKPPLSAEISDFEAMEQPKRPPRNVRRSELQEETKKVATATSGVAKSDIPLLSVPPTPGIKSILKRPSCLATSDKETLANGSAAATAFPEPAIEPTEGSSTNSRIATRTTSRKEAGESTSESATNATSTFYIPLPQTRKKVQFMMEDRIIRVDEYVENDNGNCSNSGYDANVAADADEVEFDEAPSAATAAMAAPKSLNYEYYERKRKQQKVILDKQHKRTATVANLCVQQTGKCDESSTAAATTIDVATNGLIAATSATAAPQPLNNLCDDVSTMATNTTTLQQQQQKPATLMAIFENESNLVSSALSAADAERMNDVAVSYNNKNNDESETPDVQQQQQLPHRDIAAVPKKPNERLSVATATAAPRKDASHSAFAGSDADELLWLLLAPSSNDGAEQAKPQPPDDDDEMSLLSRNPIRRSNSVRHPSSARNAITSSSDSSSGSSVFKFKDTMALRMRNGRLDARDLFANTSSINWRPREPPPPPPAPEAATNKAKLITATALNPTKTDKKTTQVCTKAATSSRRSSLSSPSFATVDATLSPPGHTQQLHDHQQQSQQQNEINADRDKHAAAPRSSEFLRNGLGNHDERQQQDAEEAPQQRQRQVVVAAAGNAADSRRTTATKAEYERNSNNSTSCQAFPRAMRRTSSADNNDDCTKSSSNRDCQTSAASNAMKTSVTTAPPTATAYNNSTLFATKSIATNQQRTVVRVAPFNQPSPEVHRLKISHSDENCSAFIRGNDFSASSSDCFWRHSTSSPINGRHLPEMELSPLTAQKKTSILINGDDCYSTMNISHDASTPLYHSSVVVADHSSASAEPVFEGLRVSTTTNTVTINVSSSAKRSPEEELIFQHNQINNFLSKQADSRNGIGTAIIPINGNSSNADDGGLHRSASSISSASATSSSSCNSSSSGSNSTKNKRSRTLIKLDYDSEAQQMTRGQQHNADPLPNKDLKLTSPKTTATSVADTVGQHEELLSHEVELVKILRNPVEAVRRNLVPHVCGRTEQRTGEAERSKKMGHSIPVNELHTESSKQPAADLALPSMAGSTQENFERNSFIAKLLEDPTLSQVAEGLENETIVQLIGNSLKRLKESRSSIDTSGTKDNDNMMRLIDLSLQKLEEERQASGSTYLPPKEEDGHSNRGSISSATSFSSANNYEMFEFDTKSESDCYQSCSSEITSPGDEESSTEAAAMRSKFYQMLVDATLAEIEISTGLEDEEVEHHYESIRNNADPIYEEITDMPPPLPLTAPPLSDAELDKKAARSMFEGASKYDILSYLVDAKERGLVREEQGFEYPLNCSNPIIIEEEAIDTLSDLGKRKQKIDGRDNSLSRTSVMSDSSEDNQSTMSSLSPPPAHCFHGGSGSGLLYHKGNAADIERNDSGVGSETSKTSRSKYQHPLSPTTASRLLHKTSPIHLCEDCDGPVEMQVTDSGVMFAPLVCRKCGKKRAERKEIITEIVETEEKYGRDLQIVLEEFCQPMLVAGLLTQEQLSAIFLNTEELLENNQTLAERMRDALDISLEQGDDDLLTVNIGRIFLDFTQMLHAFESYCVRQAGASLLLANLEKEKELLRIFLKVSQMENTVLRRMNLNSFLMVPVQRVTKYPLLLARLYKVTPAHLEGRDLLKQAQEKIELHLNHINQEAKDVPTKLWRRISSSSPNRRASCEIDMINIKLRKMAIDVLEWNHDEVRFAMEGKLLYTQPTDSNWKKARTIKLTPVNALLVTNGKPSGNYKAEKAVSDKLNFPKHTGVREASLLVVKEKCGRYTLVREPLYLDRCVVCSEADWDDYFEVQEISSKDTFIFKAEDGVRTKQWYTQLQYHAQGMGAWRKRRNALANIMINGMLARS